MKRIGIYGGSFHPVHLGHIRTAEYAIEALSLDKLIMIPSFVSPSKQDTDLAESAASRLEMLRLATDQMDRVEVSDLEIKRGALSYTRDTLEQLRQQYPQDELILIMGADMFCKLHQWVGFEQILQMAAIAVFARGMSNEMSQMQQQIAFLQAKGARVYAPQNPPIPISSEDVRRMLVFQCADTLLPPSVADYIRANGLYGVGRRYRELSLEQLESTVVKLLKPNRVAHVLGCKETAGKLARHWGVNETDALRSGLLHDITKAIDGPHQLTLCSEYGIMLDKFSQENPKTLHALTGSVVAQRIFGENPEVVSAIRSHTTGKANMNMLEKIVYVADYMEPNRDFPGVDTLRELAYSDMDQALALGLQMTLDQLQKQGRQVSPESREALEYLENH